MKTRTKRQVAREDRILEVARELIARLGYDGLTMRDLAAEANVSPTTLYNLYGNKDAVVLAAVADLLATTQKDLKRLEPQPGCEQMLTAIDLQAQQIERTPEYAAAMTRALFQAPPDHPLVYSLLSASYKGILLSLRAMQRQKQLRSDADLKRLCRMLTGAPWGSMLLWSKGLLPLGELRRALRDTLLAALITHVAPGTRRALQARLATAPQVRTAPGGLDGKLGR